MFIEDAALTLNIQLLLLNAYRGHSGAFLWLRHLVRQRQSSRTSAQSLTLWGPWASLQLTARSSSPRAGQPGEKVALGGWA